VAIAAVVQAMIESEISGIMFSANPVTSSRDEVVINASWGLGEAIVSGLVTPDTLTMRKSDGALLSEQIASKDRLIEYAPSGGTVEREVPAERRRLPALNSDQIAQLVALSGQVETHYHAPMDMEWAFARGRFYLLQARPITTIKPPAPALPQHGEYNRTMFVEIFPDPLSPVFLSVIQPLFDSMLAFTFQTLGFKPPRDVQAVATFYNQPYFNRGYIEAALRPLSPRVREQMITQIVNPFGRHARGAPVELSPAFAGMALRLLRFMLTFPGQLPGLVAGYRAEIKEFEALDVARLSDQEIVQRSRRLAFGTPSALLNYDFLMIALIGLTYQTLGSLLRRYFGEESEQVRSKLISGVTGNVTMETNKRLWDLAQSARSSPAVSQVLRQAGARECQAQLAQSEDGRAFLAELQRFLDEYGHREVRMDILYPTWREDPAPVLAFLRGYLDVSENQSPYRQQERLVKERAALLNSVRARVRRNVRGRYLIWPLFNWVLGHTQAHTRERDTMHFELTRLFPPFRRLLLELGRRWSAQSTLAESDDIFFLSLDELSEVASAPHDMREVVKTRHAEFAQNRQRGAPGIIRDGRAVEAEVAQNQNGAGRFSGVAGSPGTITGVARLIRGPEEFGQLQSGEILVAPLTNPVWTPLFAIAGGLVTEVGGILSHGAIVAREYGIPAVMGVAGAMKVIQGGQRITVDGNRGVVSLAGEAT
jgi:pyruvate,water dikinase